MIRDFGLVFLKTKFFFWLAVTFFLVLLVFGVWSGDPGFIRLEGGTL
jgi:hypothetical protein